MPAILGFGRKMMLSSDDLLAPALVGLSLNVFGVFLTILMLAKTPIACGDVFLYLSLALAFLFLAAALDAILAFLTTLGSIADQRPRRHVGALIATSIASKLPEIACHAFGIYAYLRLDFKTCQITNWIANLLLSILLLFTTRIIILYALAILTSSPIRNNSQSSSIKSALYPIFMLPLFTNRQKTDFNGNGSVGNVLVEVSKLLSRLFGTQSNLCASDVLVGLLLVKSKQANDFIASKKNRYDLGETSITLDASEFSIQYPIRIQMQQSRSGASTDNSVLLDLAAIKHFMRYACAIYGFPLYMFTNFGLGLKHLLCPCLTPKPTSALEAISLSLNNEWARHSLCCFPVSCIRAAPEHPDIAYHSIQGAVFKSPFTVTIDYPRKSVVIAIRGTMSTTDLLADLYIKEQNIEWKNEDGSSCFAATHYGIHQIASNILTELQTTSIISRLFDAASPCKDFMLVCTGHSLGGGVAAILAFLLKNSPEYSVIYKRIFAFGYAIPGVIVTSPAVEYFRTFCTSVIVDTDFIPRLTPSSITILREQIEYQLKNCFLHKNTVIYNNLIRSSESSSGGPTIVMGDSQGDVEEQPLSGGEHIIETQVDPPVSVYIPGNCVHLIRDSLESPAASLGPVDLERDSGNTGKCGYAAYLVDAREFSVIVLAATMGRDHLPNR